jgi:hypothetical protein
MLAVYVTAFALFVWAIRASFPYAFINIDAKPCKGFIYIFFRSRDKPLGIGVFYA